MGWSSGSGLLCQVIEIIEEHCHPDTDKVTLFTELITEFEDYDCDTINECLGQSPSFDIAYEKLYPESLDVMDSDYSDEDDLWEREINCDGDGEEDE